MSYRVIVIYHIVWIPFSYIQMSSYSFFNLNRTHFYSCRSVWHWISQQIYSLCSHGTQNRLLISNYIFHLNVVFFPESINSYKRVEYQDWMRKSGNWFWFCIFFMLSGFCLFSSWIWHAKEFLESGMIWLEKSNGVIVGWSLMNLEFPLLW